MKAIKTYYLGPTNTLPSRIKATDGDKNSIIVSVAELEGLNYYPQQELHNRAARRLCQQERMIIKSRLFYKTGGK